MHDIPPAVINGLFTVGVAVIGLFAGEKRGKDKVHADYVNAIELASEKVISRVTAEIAKCEEREARCAAELKTVKAQIEDLMAGRVAVYTAGGAG